MMSRRRRPCWSRCCTNNRSTGPRSRCSKCYVDFEHARTLECLNRNGGMSIGASLDQKRTNMGWGVRGFVLLLVLGSLGGKLIAQQSPRTASGRRSSSTAPSAFVDAEKLISEGKLDEAKASLEAQLKSNPKRVEGYNLLGIVCAEQKDFANALAAFQRALSIDPASTKTRNNLGNRSEEHTS